MKLLGVDLGDRRVGFAICDMELPIAVSYKVSNVRSPEDVIAAIVELKAETCADRVVIGLPLEMSGKVGKKAKEAETYKEKLSDIGIDVVLFDERLTSAAAHSAMKSANLNRKDRMKSVDAISAQLILQSYVDVNM